MAVHVGIKVWAQNIGYIPYIQKLHHNGYCDFVEVYVGIKALTEEARQWRGLNVPMRLHAPHSHGGFNPSLSQGIEAKIEALHRVEEFRQFLNPSSIVFHPGIDGSLEESLRQYQLFKKKFPNIFKVALIENKPHLGIKNEICRGDTTDEIKELISKIGFGFCLDFGHAACFAAWAKKDWKEVVGEFMQLKPNLFHLSDGDIGSPIDIHWHLGAGNFPLKKMLAFLPNEAFITLETPHDSKDNLDDFIKDSDMVRSLLK